MKRLRAGLIAMWILWAGACGPRNVPRPGVPASEARIGDAVIANAFRNRVSGAAVQSAGVVVKILPDDNQGTRHQRFILRLGSGQTVLISHNVDIAPRVSPLRAGEYVSFAGEYEWNSKGGVIHWTHHDPAGRHVPGWLNLNGKTYQ